MTFLALVMDWALVLAYDAGFPGNFDCFNACWCGYSPPIDRFYDRIQGWMDV